MRYDRVYNFSAGPAMMPESVLEEIAAEVLNYHGSGMSVMEMSHRSPVFQEILSQSEADLRTLMHIPDNYKVLFVQGGGTVQFAMVPMNLMKNGVACYVETGAWSKKAIAEAKRYGEVKIVASSADKNFSYIPNCSDLDILQALRRSWSAREAHLRAFFRRVRANEPSGRGFPRQTPCGSANSRWNEGRRREARSQRLPPAYSDCQ